MLNLSFDSRTRSLFVRALPLALLVCTETASARDATTTVLAEPVTCTTTEDKRRIGMYCGIYSHSDGQDHGGQLPGNPGDQQAYAQCQKMAQDQRDEYDSLYGCRTKGIIRIDFWTFPIFEVIKTTSCSDGRTEQLVAYEIGEGSGGSIEGPLVCEAPTSTATFSD